MNFYDTFEYNGETYVRESHSVAGIHWHPLRQDGGKSWELITGDLSKELEKQYIRGEKLKRVLKNNE